jgi:hypothetical protein
LTKTAVSGIIKTLLGQISLNFISLPVLPGKGFMEKMKKNKKELK